MRAPPPPRRGRAGGALRTRAPFGRANFDEQGLAVDIHEQSQLVDEGVRAGFAASLQHADRLSAAAVAPPAAKRARTAAAGDWDCSSSSGESGEEEEEEKEVRPEGGGAARAAESGAGAAAAAVEEAPAATVEEAPAAAVEKAAPKPAPAPTPRAPVVPEHLDLTAFSSAAQLEGLGLDRLKAALMAAGLKCGGTLKERAARLFSVRGLEPAAFPAALRAIRT